ncbi:MAG: acyltransferase [Chitinophagaceae bacterium]|nr:MAG: acyltransferase [Chitinophagaceae bacterium]
MSTATVLNQPAEMPTPIARKKEFISYIHNFRGVAICFVVAPHILLAWDADSQLYKFFRVLWENGTVLFIFIAGYLFQYLSHRFEYKDYLKKKMEGVILPYFIVSAPIIVYRLMTNDNPGYILDAYPDFTQWAMLKKLAYFIFTGAHMQQMWFIPMIMIYYLIAPLLLWIDKHPKYYLVILPLIVVSLIVIREPFNEIFRMFFHFLSVYMFGMFMSRYRKEYLEFAKKYWVAITALAVITVAVNFYFYPAYNSPLNYLQKMSFCLFFIYWLWKLNDYIPKILGAMAELSFGIFFIHYYFVLILRKVAEKIWHGPAPGNIFYWIASVFIVFALCFLVLNTVKKIFPRHSKNLVGC